MEDDHRLLRKYRQAAVAYFVYGIIYLSGAIYVARTGIVDRDISGGYGWIYFLLGGILVVGIPLLIRYGSKWVTRILVVLILVRVGGLGRVLLEEGARPVPAPWGGSVPMGLGAGVFLAVAVVAGVLLARAGWDL